MTEKEYNYKKPKFGYDKDFNNSKEYMREFKSIERSSNKWNNFVDFFNVQHSLSRWKLAFIGGVIAYFAAPEFVKVIIAAQLPAFFNFYGATILALSALFVLTKIDKH